MRGAGDVVTEERLVRLDLVDPVQPIDGVVGHPCDQVPSRFALEWVDLRSVAEEVGLPLVGIAADKTIEVFKALSDRPLVKRANLAGLEGGHIVLLAEPRGGVTIFQEDAANGRLVLGHDAVVAGEAGRLLGDDAEARRVSDCAR